jgi:hypothetical protein
VGGGGFSLSVSKRPQQHTLQHEPNDVSAGVSSERKSTSCGVIALS